MLPSPSPPHVRSGLSIRTTQAHAASRNAPNAAKSDLKRQLKNFKVRPAIEQAIVKALNPTTSAPPPQTADVPDEPAAPGGTSAASAAPPSDRPITPAVPEQRPEAVEPLYVNTQRELDDIFREMHVYFEDKETEQNWMKREESMTTLRRLIAGNAATDFREPFLAGLRALLDGIIKAINSLRTSLSKEGCSLVQDIARAYGPGMDPMVELLMQTFIKLTAATKKISSQLANVTVDTIIARVTYNTRIMQHIWGACQDKNVQPRLYVAGWLRTLLTKKAHNKSQMESTGGVDLIEKCIKKGLGDANPGVRERMRGTYWTFAELWPARAEAIMNGLDGTAQRLLQNDPNNPNSPPKRSQAGGPRPGMGLSKSTLGTSKPSLRDTMLAHKKAMTSKALPARPGSAMSTFSPVGTVSSASQAPSGAVRTRPESAIMSSGGGISGAPMRPGRRRPEVAARPATAGPYSVRSHDQPSTEQASPPRDARSRVITPKPIASSPKRTAHKTVRPNQATAASESQLPTPTRSATPKPSASPRATPPRTLPSDVGPASSSPTRADEEMTLVVPNVTIPTEILPPPLEQQSPPRPIEAQPVAASASSTPSRIPRLSSSALSSPSLRAAPPPAAVGSPPGTPPPIYESGPLAPAAEIVPAATAAPKAPASPGSPGSPARSVEVYEDPLTAKQATPPPAFAEPVLEVKPVNEDAGVLQHASQQPNGEANGVTCSPDKVKQNTRLLDSGIAKVQQKSLDVYGFRKLQGILRDGKAGATVLTDEKFDALVSGLFAFLEAPLAPPLSPAKAQDVKTQILTTLKLLLRRARPSFRRHVSRGLESLLRARAAYETRTHIVGGLELFAAELAALGDPSEIVTDLSRLLADLDVDSPRDSRSLSMGLHVLRELLEGPRSNSDGSGNGNGNNGSSDSAHGGDGKEASFFCPGQAEMDALAALAARCLDSVESAVRMDAVLLCVALHARVGDARFWEAVKGVKEDPKSLITYYIVRRQREMGGVMG